MGYGGKKIQKNQPVRKRWVNKKKLFGRGVEKPVPPQRTFGETRLRKSLLPGGLHLSLALQSFWRGGKPPSTGHTFGFPASEGVLANGKRFGRGQALA